MSKVEIRSMIILTILILLCMACGALVALHHLAVKEEERALKRATTAEYDARKAYLKLDEEEQARHIETRDLNAQLWGIQQQLESCNRSLKKP